MISRPIQLVAKCVVVVAVSFVGQSIELGHAAESDLVQANASLPYSDLLYLGDRPTRIRLHLFVDGKPWNEMRQELVRQQFLSLDSDHDGLLLPEQLKTLPLAGFEGTTIASWDLDHDEKLNATEFLRFFDDVGEPAFLLAEGEGRAANRIELFPKLDGNGDRRLSQEELATARQQLVSLDYDDDETISTTELTPFSNPLVPQVVNARERPLSGRAPFLAIASYPSMLELAEVVIRRYRQSAPGSGVTDITIGDEGETAADQSETDQSETDQSETDQSETDQTGAPPASGTATVLECAVADLQWGWKESAAWDQNGDGRITPKELVSYLRASQPDFELQVELPCRQRGRPSLRQRTASESAAEKSGSFQARRRAMRQASSRLPLQIGSTSLDIRAESTPSLLQDNKSFYLLQFRVADANKNNYLEPEEYAAVGLDAAYATLDVDGNQQLMREELQAFLDRDAFTTQSQIVLSIASDTNTLFQVMDVDLDQRLTMREFRDVLSRTAVLDLDQDGMIASHELTQQYRLSFSMGKPRIFQQAMATTPANTPAPRATPNRDAPGWFQKMDRNQDGDLSWREFLGRRVDFDRLDQNRDGLVTATEVAEMVDQVSADRPIATAANTTTDESFGTE